ncbi:helix-turn-helix domain-containing protein [Streptomyces sp. NPDC046716]|uniref:TetR/AcrR family transcriptional regulator n=1 Tax=Streptomyces sp. NPDC046716 TaxID=3157093 RepID=UPI0033F62836
MARPRGFDTGLAVERAMRLFCRQGYHATPMPHLTARLRIGSGSLYAAFGSKEELYGRALDLYCADLVRHLTERLRADGDIRATVRELLLALAAADLADPEQGCLLVNAATERAGHPATVDRVRAAMDAVEHLLADALRRARARGELRAVHDPAELARFLTTFVQGLRVMGNARAGREFLESAVSGALRVLD